MGHHRNNRQKPLFRKVNTRARGVHHNHGGVYRNNRGKNSPYGMRQGIQRGLNYTPLFKFLLSKVGCQWNEVHSEAVARLDKEEPVYWIVAQNKEDATAVIRIGESSYFSGLYIDDDGVLKIVDPEISEKTLEPHCACCTHTFNGILFEKKHKK